MNRSLIVLYPGLGANSGLFFEQKKHLGEKLLIPEWIAPKRSEELSEYCYRLVEQLITNPVLMDSDRVYLGGFSFGGMVALEMASIINQNLPGKVKGVVLISSGRTKQIIRTLFRVQALIGSQLPSSLLKGILKKQLLANFVKRESLNFEQLEELSAMLSQFDFGFFKWSLRACAKWNPGSRFLPPQVAFPIFEIQGEKDHIIPFSTESDVLTIPEAKHLIQYTHSREVNQWLDQIIKNG